ncbi:(2Fe-2S)-binding protein, partial [Klebsiella pneumoniae]|uniref:(2Fe-2S)-binding protein n=1 Tax=Klebsiella pneumoniae TaxID=573 RepID=UPI00195420A4
TVLCRCEGLTAGELRGVAKARGGSGPTGDLNRAKAFTRTGMGRCQGRVCGPAAAQIFAAEAGCDLSAIGRLRGQPPVKPFAMGPARAAADTD